MTALSEDKHGSTEPTTTQHNVFVAELRSTVRLADGRSKYGKLVAEVGLAMIEDPRLADEVFRCASVAMHDTASMRRIREAGYQAGLDESLNTKHSTDTTSEEDTA